MTDPVFVAEYELDMHVEFVGPMPDRDNRAAPEASPAQFAAAAAVKAVLREHGFTVVGAGHGSRRVGSTIADPSELA